MACIGGGILEKPKWEVKCDVAGCVICTTSSSCGSCLCRSVKRHSHPNPQPSRPTAIPTHSHPNPQPSQSIAHSPAADVGHGPRPAWLLLTAVWAGQFLHHGLLVRAVTRQTRRGAVTNRHRLGCPSLGIRLHPFAMPAACLSRQMLVQVRAKEQWDVDVKHAFEYIKGKVRPSAMPQALVGLGPWAWPLRMREGPNM